MPQCSNHDGSIPCHCQCPTESIRVFLSCVRWILNYVFHNTSLKHELNSWAALLYNPLQNTKGSSRKFWTWATSKNILCNSKSRQLQIKQNGNCNIVNFQLGKIANVSNGEFCSIRQYFSFAHVYTSGSPCVSECSSKWSLDDVIIGFVRSTSLIALSSCKPCLEKTEEA